uniref:VWFD domain-containing protein n=1 Tax=Poecilia latipinna TaxID=48699 RepID=A0A3B3VEE9_9TELE
MDSKRWLLALCFFSASGKSAHFYTCKTFGSGVIKAFRGSPFYVRSNCPFTFARFTHNRVECDITIRRGQNGLLNLLEIIINKVKTVVQNGTILVEKKSISLPYDHTYQHIFQYGIYTRLRSSLLPLSVTWQTAAGGGLVSVWVRALLNSWTHKHKSGQVDLCSTFQQQGSTLCCPQLVARSICSFSHNLFHTN